MKIFRRAKVSQRSALVSPVFGAGRPPLRVSILALVWAFVFPWGAIERCRAQVEPQARELVNSLGMKLVRLEPGTYRRGQARENGRQNITQTYGNRHFLGGEVDEQPVHTVKLSRPFFMAATEVTNAQYEQYDPKHSQLRGQLGLSREDDEAVVFVSWHEAKAFCDWLSEKEGATYRLPTEAEWEYACRAGTTTRFHTGDSLPEAYQKSQRHRDEPVAVSTHVARTPANAWGLHDMHGNVEEWCHDPYGPYIAEAQTDPVGRESSLWRVVRGGSHNAYVKSLRSANRLSTLAEDAHWLLGFRVVRGELPKTRPLPPESPSAHQRNVRQKKFDWPRKKKPFFAGPTPFVKAPDDPESVPFFFHNHVPSVAWCDNGDLLAAWFSCARERGRDLGIVASRFRRATGEWDPASAFFNARDRNMHGTALFNDGNGRLLHLNGLGTDGWWSKLALVRRVSTDHGATWSYPDLVDREHGTYIAHMGISRTRDGALIFPCDAPGGTGFYRSRDDGVTWSMATRDGSRKNILGTHAAVVELADGNLYALGRGKEIDGRMPVSLSKDFGETWTYSASEFPPVSGGQRAVLLRLNEGAILYVGFTDTAKYQKVIVDRPRPRMMSRKGIPVRDAEGKRRTVYGMFAAVSFDEAKTWPLRKLLTPGGSGTLWNGEAWTQDFILDETHAEPLGYLAMTQSPDDVVHLVSSGLHYQFNLEWLRLPMAPESGAGRRFFLGGAYPVRRQGEEEDGVLAREFLFDAPSFGECGASTIAATRDGLVAAWTAVPRDGAAASVWFSKNTSDGWLPPKEIASGREAAGGPAACSHPVLFAARPGPLVLFYQVGSHRDASLARTMTSHDGGRTWTKSSELPQGFLGPVKNSPLQLPGGDLFCGGGLRPRGDGVAVDLLSLGNNTWRSLGTIPAGDIVGAKNPTFLTYLRDHPSRDRFQVLCQSAQNVIVESWTRDAGRTWDPCTPTSLPNPDAPIDAITLSNGRQFLVYNHTGVPGKSPRGLERLNVALSKDGKSWEAALTLESEPGEEFSHPAVIQTADDRVHVTYTWRRQKIQHVVIDPTALSLTEIVGGAWPSSR